MTLLNNLRKRDMILLSLLVVSLITVSLYQTLATDITMNKTNVASVDLSYTFDIKDTTGRVVNVKSGATKVLDIFLTNTNSGTINYGIAYTPSSLKTDDIIIAQIDTSKDKVSGLINKDEKKQITIIIINNSTSDISLTLVPVTGYEHGGDLIVPDNHTLISESYQIFEPVNGVEYIESLLPSNPETMNNDDPDGNVRYMGADPNNYVDIGDKYPEGFTVEKWEELGMNFENREQCSEKIINMCSKYYAENGFSSEEECNTLLLPILPEQFGVSSFEELSNNYCVVENKSNEPILWRIIGVFDVASTYGGPTEKRFKIIRNESLGNMAWDSSNVNDWSKASLQTYLNGEYYNSIDSTSQSLIGDAVWNLGGTASYTSSSNGLASHFYGYERGTTVYSGHPTYWVGKIGLMYPSDYGYATSGGTTTDRVSCLKKELYGWNDSNYSDCKNNDYLYNSSLYQWILTPHSSSSAYVFYVVNSGYVYRNVNAINSSYSASPVLYLKSTVQITGGEGTSENPYTLG